MKPLENSLFESKVTALLSMPIVTVEQIVRFRTEAMNYIKALEAENSQLHTELMGEIYQKNEVLQFAQMQHDGVVSYLECEDAAVTTTELSRAYFYKIPNGIVDKRKEPPIESTDDRGSGKVSS